jgi:hypothetical protein
MDADLRRHIDGGYDFCEEQQRRLDRGEISEAEWFEIHRAFFSANYLACADPRGQSGHSGDEARYRYTQGMVLEAIDRDGSFIDVGCANGYLMEKLSEWLGATGRSVVFHGLDISPDLVALARKRLPDWKERFFIGNALNWAPPRGFGMVCVKELGYVPRVRRRALFENLMTNVVAPCGRLILGPLTEIRAEASVRDEIAAWGYRAASTFEKPHQDRPQLVRRLFWFDKQV